MDANAKLVTAQGIASFDANKGVAQAAGSAALMDVNMTHPNGNINSKVGYVAGSGEISSSGIKGKAEAVATSLEGEYKGNLGNLGASAKTFSADAELTAALYGGKDGIIGGEFKASAQASAISGGIKGCLGTDDSFVKICGKLEGNAGPSFDVSGKGIIDTNKGIAKAGLGGKLLGGAEVEFQINWKKIWDWWYK